MSNKYKVYSRREVEKLLKRNGYHVVSQRGDHVKWTNGKSTFTVTRKNENPIVLRRMIRTYNLATGEEVDL